MKLQRTFTWMLFAAALIFTAGCKNTKTGNLTIQIKPKYGTQDVVLNDANLTVDPNNRRIQFNTLKFYLSHITLVKTDNSETEVKDVAIFDMSDPSLATLTINNLSGSYKAIKFGCGIDSVQNLSDPLSISGPLNGSNGMAWPMLKYQFEIFEARMDTIPGDLTTLPDFFPQYHIGGNDFYRHTQLSNSFFPIALFM